MILILSECVKNNSYFYLFFKNPFASFRKLNAIITITIPIGNAATILTDCRLLIELSANKSAIGNNIKRIHHINCIFLLGCSFSPSLL